MPINRTMIWIRFWILSNSEVLVGYVWMCMVSTCVYEVSVLCMVYVHGMYGDVCLCVYVYMWCVMCVVFGVCSGICIWNTWCLGDTSCVYVMYKVWGRVWCLYEYVLYGIVCSVVCIFLCVCMWYGYGMILYGSYIPPVQKFYCDIFINVWNDLWSYTLLRSLLIYSFFFPSSLFSKQPPFNFNASF